MADGHAPAKKKTAKVKGPSPFMAQYLEIKEEHADALLFFRMGDFYELFFQDAVDAADILGITLTVGPTVKLKLIFKMNQFQALL